MFRLATALLTSCVLILAALPAAAQSAKAVRAQIEKLHGDALGFDESFNLLTGAMKFGDPVTVADLGAYPLTINANGETYDIQSAQDLEDNYATLIMQETQSAVAEQSYGDLIVNSDGVGLANGALWMGSVCDTDDCSKSHWAITSISN